MHVHISVVYIQVVQAYQREGFSFLLKAFNEPSYLEDLTGLTQMHAETLDAEVKGPFRLKILELFSEFATFAITSKLGEHGFNISNGYIFIAKAVFGTILYYVMNLILKFWLFQKL